MLGHRKGAAHQIVELGQPVDETDLIEPLGGEAEPERHLHCDRVGQIRDMPVIVAAEEPALRLRHLEERPLRGDP